MHNFFDHNTEEELYEHLCIRVDPKQQPLRLDKFLHNRLTSKSRNRIQHAIAAGNITVNNKAVKSSYLIRPTDHIRLILPHPPDILTLKPQNIPVNIVYEDEDILVINKGAGMVVHPGFGNYQGTLLNALLYHLDANNTACKLERCGLVHRIDKNTTGLLVVTKNEASLTALARQFYEHTVTRTYHALVWGHVQTHHNTLKGYIARSPKNRKIMQVSENNDKGKTIITHYKLLKSYYYVSLLELRLETGRTHQIRAHMKFIGHPLFGDSSYGGAHIIKGPNSNQYKNFVNSCLELANEQLLHAKTLGFMHPRTKKYMEFNSELPQNFSSVLAKWENFTKTAL